MAVIVCCTTMSFNVAVHYCGDSLVDYSFLHKAKTCGMEMKPEITKSCETKVTRESCCKDKQLIVKGQDDLKPAFDSFSLNQQVFIAAFFQAYTQLFIDEDETLIAFKAYSPPDITPDIQLLDETFLI